MNVQDSAARIQFRLRSTTRPSGEKGRSDAQAAGDGRLPRITQVMALAVQFQDMIQRGEARDYADLARLGCLTRERMSQIMELVWLAPDIQREILEIKPTHTTRFPISEPALRRVAASLAWEEQRRAWCNLKQEKHLS